MDKQTGSGETIVFTIFVPILVVVCSVGLSYLKATFGLILTITTIVVILIAFPALLYMVSVIFNQLFAPYFEKNIETELKAIQVRFADNKIMNGICKEEQLALMERTKSFEEIWLISPDLLTEIDSGIYSGVVYENLKKGTKYKYFVPNSDINKVRVKIFKNQCKNNPNLEVYYLDEDFFFLVPHVDFAIYEPMKSVSDGKQGYIGLPIEGAKDNFAALMNNDFVDAVVGKLAEKISKREQ